MPKNPKKHLVRSVILGEKGQATTSAPNVPPSTKNVKSKKSKKAFEFLVDLIDLLAQQGRVISNQASITQFRHWDLGID